MTSLIIASLNCLAQPDTISTVSRGGSISLGISGGDYRYDPALGLEITSPQIFINHLRIRLKANRTWLEQYKSSTGHWVTFNSYWAGLVYNTNTIERARVFFEGGFYILSPNKIFSSAKLHTGYYGAVGLELFVVENPKERLAYFLSGGFASIQAYADKLEGSPRYGNGLIFVNGLRYYF